MFNLIQTLFPLIKIRFFLFPNLLNLFAFGFELTADSDLSMATEAKAVTEDVKIDLFEDDDEFEEFEINEGMNQ